MIPGLLVPSLVGWDVKEISDKPDESWHYTDQVIKFITRPLPGLEDGVNAARLSVDLPCQFFPAMHMLLTNGLKCGRPDGSGFFFGHYSQSPSVWGDFNRLTSQPTGIKHSTEVPDRLPFSKHSHQNQAPELSEEVFR